MRYNVTVNPESDSPDELPDAKAPAIAEDGSLIVVWNDQSEKATYEAHEWADFTVWKPTR